jgi:hypothetical protein
MQVLIPHFAKMEQAKTFNASVDRQHALASVRRLPNPDTGSMLGDFPDLDKVKAKAGGRYTYFLVALRTWIRLTLHRQTESLSLARSFFPFSGQGALCTSFLEFRGLA